MAALLTCPNPACAELNDPEAARCESCGARMGLGFVTAEEVRLARRLRALGPEDELRIGGRELVALSRAAADPWLRPTGRTAVRMYQARRKVERASEALAAAAAKRSGERLEAA